ncbi:MAG: glycosyltransferase family 39 protein [Spartobacteria bacterium]
MPRLFVKTRLMRAPQDRHVRLALLIGVAAVAVRLIAINQPFIDQWSWRQSDVAAIARNFFQNGFLFAYPQIDWAGEQPGYVGTEFPILPFKAALCYKLLGVHEWIGRVQAVILFALSLPFFFLIVRRIFGATAAVWALFFYSFAPLSVMTGRCFMPDMPALSLSIIALYFFQRWIDDERSTCLFVAAAAVSLSILIKAPSAVIGAPLAYLAFAQFGLRTFRRIELWIFAAIALMPAALWYWHAANVAAQFYPFHFFGAGGFHIESAAWYWKIAKLVIFSSLTPLLCALAAVGIFTARSTISARPLYAWLVAMLLFVLVVGYGNRHPWYQLPFVPIAAAFAGVACQRVIRRRALQLLFVSGFSFFSFNSTKIYYRESAADLRAAGLALSQITDKKSLIVAADYGDPSVFYYAERKGWHFLERDGIYNGHPNESADAIADLEQLRARGATHIVFYSASVWWLDYYKEFAEHLQRTATLTNETPQFKIYRLGLVSRRD